MTKAELIIVNGPRAGDRVDLSKGSLFIGRAPEAELRLSEPDIAWRHCQIRQQGDRFLIADLRTAIGVYVNGMRCAERWLDDRDQITIGRTTLMYRNGDESSISEIAPATAVENKSVLLSACSLVFLSRALAGADDNGNKQVVQTQILRLVSDLIPTTESCILLGGKLEALEHQLDGRQIASSDEFKAALGEICEAGAYASEDTGVLGVPLYTHGRLGAALLLRLADKDKSALDVHLQTLTAIASLASIGFEAYQEVEGLKAKNALLEEQIAASAGIVGDSPAIRKLIALIDRVARHDTTVLITGESGTGKELIARALHNKSPRCDQPFIAVNCAAISETLFESELFGHEKGAFSGAIAMKRGKFELANGGSIFLDEVGELALSLQAKLLRVLQQREFERVGGTQVFPLDIRLIAATNRDLSDDIREGKFREDLFHRLNVVNLESPALRDRREDILPLATHFLQRSSEKCKRHVEGFAPEAEQAMTHYGWPGNVRELENAVERAVVLGVSDRVLIEDLPEALLESAPMDASSNYHSSVGQAKREAILDAYVQGSGDYKQAARILGIHPNYLLRLVRNLALRDDIKRRMEESVRR